MSGRDRQHMRECLALARRSIMLGEVPVGAVVIDADGKTIGRGHNRPVGFHDPSAHAEILAMREAGQALGNYRLDGCTLYVTLEPCPMCLAAASHARIARIVYAAPDPRAGACGSAIDLNRSDWHHFRPVIDTGPCEAEAADLLTQFFQARR
ncbi:nucleoside deaminase [Guyparkeria hydrothermalis]|uniref:nucleoside deaminase n=1 Tax=Guyparkeria hydrothermalis TaxID=923 RepID=UPI0020208C01|nr:nucleoside deaminase [Guyparkeria hydrothermalis]MCL7743739.1 nucleoside deaminase [Guyparkeria hydrothermalis]